MADFIRSIEFRYYDAQGIRIPAPGGLEAQATARRSITRVEVTLTGVAADRDPGYLDLFDSAPATQRQRKFVLAGAVYLTARPGSPDPGEPPSPVPVGTAW